MGARFRSRWQTIKQHWVAILVVAIASIIAGYRFDWTGFKGKTLWDWLGLLTALAIPVAVGFGVAWYSARQNHDREIAREQHENDLRIATDNQRDAALQLYIDKMSELMLYEKLRESQSEVEVRNIARVRTLTLLPKLDPLRKRTVIRFLQESGLISKGKPIVDLSSANLLDADLHGAILCEVDMHEIDFRGANLHRANLSGSDFRKTNLRRVNLDGANLDGVELSGAALNGANLKDAIGITLEELEKQAKSLKGATMPDGSIHP
jgi:uncharacterized protein YjbI with pentapeptide repeats